MLYPTLALGILLPMYVASEKICGATGALSDGNLLYLPNAWNDDGSGFACVTEDGSTGGFAADWSWSKDPASVHSYSGAKLQSELLPIQLSAAKSLNVDIDWSMSTTKSNDKKTSKAVIANVAFDMFADADVDKASDSTAATIEFMIWLGSRGAPWPIGYQKSPSNGTFHLGDQLFYLYIGTNQRGTTVYSWLATHDIKSVTGDLLPLIMHLVDKGYVESSIYLGTIEFGTEASHSPHNVTFEVPKLVLDISNKSKGATLAFGSVDASSSGWIKQSMAPSEAHLCFWLRLCAILLAMNGIV